MGQNQLSDEGQDVRNYEPDSCGALEPRISAGACSCGLLAYHAEVRREIMASQRAFNLAVVRWFGDDLSRKFFLS